MTQQKIWLKKKSFQKLFQNKNELEDMEHLQSSSVFTHFRKEKIWD
jgi:hypothetical protein